MYVCVCVCVCNDRPPKTPDAVAPSPWDLRGKIILKGKRHMIAGDDDDDDDDIDVDLLKKTANNKGLVNSSEKAAQLKKLRPSKTYKEKAKKQSVSDKLSSLIWMNAGNKKELGEIWKSGAFPSAGGFRLDTAHSPRMMNRCQSSRAKFERCSH